MIASVSKKRKHPNKPRGGRYTPPGRVQHAVPRSVPTDDTAGLFDLSGLFGFDDGDDDRYPITIQLENYGTWTVPQAFAWWLDSEALIDEFDAFMCERRASEDHGDVHALFIEGRADVPSAVAAAVAGYEDYMNEHFGTVT